MAVIPLPVRRRANDIQYVLAVEFWVFKRSHESKDRGMPEGIP